MSAEVSDGIRIVEIVATVEFQSNAEKQEMVGAFRRSPSVDPDRRERAIERMQDPSKYTMYVRLAANLSDGRHVSTGVRDFSFGGPRHGLAAIWHRYRGPKLSDDPAEQVRLLQETYHVGLSDVQGRHQPDARTRPRATSPTSAVLAGVASGPRGRGDPSDRAGPHRHATEA